MATKTNILETNRTIKELALSSKISVDIQDAIIDIKNIVFNEPFTLKGNYTFGLIKTSYDDIVTIDAGTTLHEMFVSAFIGETTNVDPETPDPEPTPEPEPDPEENTEQT